MGKDRQTYKIAGPATWELIRAAYLAGDSAPALAERFGVSEHAIRKRITVEKWSKRAYAAALEARGLEPPPRAKPLNVAERFAARYVAPPTPPPTEPEAQHPFADLVDALKDASAAAQENAARADTAVAEAPEELERRALAQAGAAIAKGKAADAKAFAALADSMRRRVDSAEEEIEAQAERARTSQAEAEDLILQMFMRAAHIAITMVHNPSAAPAAFQNLVRAWRMHNLGEGEEDAEKAAARMTASREAYLRGDLDATLPDDVQAFMEAAWAARRAELVDAPLIPRYWEAEESGG